jgi:hypothetical protein
VMKNPRYLDPKLSERVTGLVDWLREVGMEREEVFQILYKFPTSLFCNVEGKVKPTVAYLQDEGVIGDKSIKTFLLSNWNNLNYSIDRIKSRLERLRAVGVQMKGYHITMKTETFDNLVTRKSSLNP